MIVAVSGSAVRERPILFSAPMVRAILDGRKTQTRRVARFDDATMRALHETGSSAWTLTLGADGYGGLSRKVYGGEMTLPIRCPYGAVGDRLWVKEGHAIRSDVCPKTDPDKARHYLRYRADREDGDDLGMEWHDYGRGWRPSIFMPRWASRITLEITEVRVQRLQEISEDDARAEGVDWRDADHARTIGLHRITFAKLWDSINSKRRVSVPKPWPDTGMTSEIDTSASWESNLWVWAMTFRRVP